MTISNDTSMDYLKDLVNTVKNAHINQSILRFKIMEIRDKGFLIKVCGLFGFVSFFHLPWYYNKTDYWSTISPYLIGKGFHCKIFALDTGNPIRILIDAKVHKFYTLDIPRGTPIEGVVIGKYKYGVLIEFGHLFHWRYGSCTGIIHKYCTEDKSILTHAQTGDQISTTYWGTDQENRVILGDKDIVIPWILENNTAELDALVGTIIKAKVHINKKGISQLIVNDKYKGYLLFTKAVYPKKYHRMIRQCFYQIKHNDYIICEVLKINYLSNKIALKWSINLEIFEPNKLDCEDP